MLNCSSRFLKIPPCSIHVQFTLMLVWAFDGTAEDTLVFAAQGSSLELCCRKVKFQIYVDMPVLGPTDALLELLSLTPESGYFKEDGCID